MAVRLGPYGRAMNAAKMKLDREMEKLVQRVMDLVNGDLPK
jgi:hypothetical protein